VANDQDDFMWDLFRRLRDALAVEYGTAVVLSSDPADLVLRVRATRSDAPDQYPRFSVTVRRRGEALLVTHRSKGWAAMPTVRQAVADTEPDLRQRVFDLVMGHLAEERRRVIEFRQSR
jgi:hypothetical protein